MRLGMNQLSSLNHASGFLKFSDLIIESQDKGFGGVGIATTSTNIDITVDHGGWRRFKLCLYFWFSIWRNCQY